MIISSYDPELEEFCHPSVHGVPIPNIWASDAAFKETWKEWKETFDFQTPTTSFPSSEWSVFDCLRWIYKRKHYARHLKNRECAKLIVRGDSFVVGGKPASFLILTLLNFGVLSKCIAFNFVINLAEVW